MLDVLHAEVASLKVAISALAETHPNKAFFREAFMVYQSAAESAWLNSQLSDRLIRLRQQECGRLASVLFADA